MAVSTGADAMLEMKGICKTFGPVKALQDVDFDVLQGEVHALLGVNGAGKSTLIKIISGLYTLDAGSMKIDGQEVHVSSPRDAIDAGIAAVQQHPELVGDFDGYENIFLGQESAHTGLFSRVNHKSMRLRAEELLKKLPVDIDLSKKIDNLPSVEREIVAILHSLKQDNIKILILDEPTSTLTQVEKERLFETMKVLKSSGVSIIYITHHLDEVFEIADRFTVFRGGKKITTMTPKEAQDANISIPTLMLDEEMGDLFPPKRATQHQGELVLQIEDLCLSGAFQNISFNAHKGEVVGVYGLVGSGIDELGKALFGALAFDDGAVKLNGKNVKFANPQQALKAGVFLVPGDRRTEGLVLADNVVFNTTLARLGRASTMLGLLKFGKNKQITRDLSAEVELSPPIVERPVSQFSGGNQQKIVVAKGLYKQADLYIFVEPTIGVDIGARATLYKLIKELSKDAAVIVMSSDCDEVFGVSDRVCALYRGQLVDAPSATLARDGLMEQGFVGQSS